jgi:hypothetical protein
MSQTPTDIANQALDAIGLEFTLGDIEDGTRPAQVCLRAYWQCLRQLLRAAHWNFARASAPLTLLADATGQTPNVGTIVPFGPFVYEYAYPIDCMKMRFIPWNQNPVGTGSPSGNIVPPNQAAPLMPGLGQPPFQSARIFPARWVEATDSNYPPQPGAITWETQGVSPAGRTVILTNVQFATAVYTKLMLYPSVWDVNFRAALVAYLASEICMALHKDKKLALAMRAPQIEIAKQKIAQARITDGNEAVTNTDHIPDWIKSRNTGGGWAGWGGYGNSGWFAGGAGLLFGGWDGASFSDGSCY